MLEPDDRLVGDPVWELFPSAAPARPPRSRPVLFWGTAAILVVSAWFVFPPLSVTLACLAAALKDFQAGRRLGRAIPDKAGGRICALFAYAWGAWKLGATGFGSILVTAAILAPTSAGKDPTPAVLAGLSTAILCGFLGFLASAALTAAGLVTAFRAGMRVWVGQGINQARTLLLGMLIVGFTFVVLGPWCVWLARLSSPADSARSVGLGLGISVFGFLFVAPVAILIVLDRICRRIVADRPGKFGPKVPAVGKWD